MPYTVRYIIVRLIIAITLIFCTEGGDSNYQHRKTIGGRLCAQSFAYNNVVYYGCSKGVNPRGESNKEWCYISNQIVNNSNSINLSFLETIKRHSHNSRDKNGADNNVDSSRDNNVDSSTDGNAENGKDNGKDSNLANNADTNVANNADTNVANNAVTNADSNGDIGYGIEWDYCREEIDYDRIKRIFTKGLDFYLDKSKQSVQMLDLTLMRVNDVLLQYKLNCQEAHEKFGLHILSLGDVLHGAQESLRKIVNNKGLFTETLNKIITLEQSLEKSIEANKADRRYCGNNLKGYEDVSVGSGIDARIYNNTSFLGAAAMTSRQYNLNLFIPSTGLNDKLSPYHYSVEMYGYVKPQRSGYYRFYIESRCGSILSLSDNDIINDRLQDYGNVKSLLPFESYAGMSAHEKQSELIYLNSTKAYKISAQAIHSSTYLYREESIDDIEIRWETSALGKEVVGSKYLFPVYPMMKSKFSNLSSDQFESDFIIPGVSLFKGSKDYTLSKIGSQYYNMRLLRNRLSNLSTRLQLRFKLKTHIYVAYSCNAPFPFHSDDITVHSTNDIAEVLLSSGDLLQMKIDFITTRDDQSITLTPTASASKYFIFIAEVASENYPCGGKELLVSNISSPYVSYCNESSKVSSKHDCAAAFKNITAFKNTTAFKDTTKLPQSSGWQTMSGADGVGQYVEIKFNHYLEISKVEFMPLPDTASWPRKLKVYFSESLSDWEAFEDFIDNEVNMSSLVMRDTHVADYIRVEIADMYQVGNGSGGSFNVYGRMCNDSALQRSSKQFAHLSNMSEMSVTSCDATLYSFEDTLLNIGTKYVLHCALDCADDYRSPVYGDSSYALESAVCRSMVHAGLCASSKDCKALAVIAKGTGGYDVNVQNNIVTHSYGPSPLSLKLLEVPELAVMPPNFILVLLFQDKDAGAVNWGTNNPPNTTTQYLTAENAESSNEIVMYDSGNVYRINTRYTYGWRYHNTLLVCENVNINTRLNVNMNEVSNVNMNEVSNVNMNELSNVNMNELSNVNMNEVSNTNINRVSNTFSSMAFNVLPNQRQCVDGYNCEKNSFLVDLPANGYYDLTLQLGSACLPETGRLSQYVQLNGENVVSNLHLAMGEFHWVTHRLLVRNNLITVTADCDILVDRYKCRHATTLLVNIRFHLRQRL